MYISIKQSISHIFHCHFIHSYTGSLAREVYLFDGIQKPLRQNTIPNKPKLINFQFKTTPNEFQRRKKHHSDFGFNDSNLSRKSMEPSKPGIINHFPFKYAKSLLKPGQRHLKRNSTSNLFSKTKQSKNKSKSHNLSSHSGQTFNKGLGHDLHQLTKGNYHEVNLSPNPSLTIMVQPNKIDYSKNGRQHDEQSGTFFRSYCAQISFERLCFLSFLYSFGHYTKF